MVRARTIVSALAIAMPLLGCVPTNSLEAAQPDNMKYNPKLSATANAVITKQGLNPEDYFKTDDGCYFDLVDGGFEAVSRQLYDYENDRPVCD